jgi:hypothetical protein
VVSGGVLCLLGLAAVLRLFPKLLSYEVARGDPAPAATESPPQ